MTFSPALGLFWYYVLAGSVLLSLAGVMGVAWLIRRDPMANLVMWLFVWIAVDLYVRAIMRSPQAIVPGEWLLMTARAATAGETVLGFLVADAYFAQHNGHLNLLRRMLRWWDPDAGEWRGSEHGS